MLAGRETTNVRSVRAAADGSEVKVIESGTTTTVADTSRLRPVALEARNVVTVVPGTLAVPVIVTCPFGLRALKDNPEGRVLVVIDVIDEIGTFDGVK